jgi:hypothetical protein
MSVFTSPYNSPQAQHRRLLGVAEKYRDNAQTLKFTGLWLGGIGGTFVLVGSGIWSFLGLCMLGTAFAAYHFLSVHYDSPYKPASLLLGDVAERYRVNAQTLKTAGLWLGGIGAAFVLMESGIWSSFLGLCMLGAAFAAYHFPSVRYDSPPRPASFKCPYCSHQMALFQQWICGHCETWNEARKRTFVESCIHCNLEPHSLLCSACGKLIVFQQYNYDFSPEEYARFPGSRPRETGRAEDSLAERRKRLRL